MAMKEPFERYLFGAQDELMAVRMRLALICTSELKIFTPPYLLLWSSPPPP